MNGLHDLKEFVLKILRGKTKIHLKSQEQKLKKVRGRPATQVEKDIETFEGKKDIVEGMLENLELNKSSSEAIEKKKLLSKARNVAAAAGSRMN